MGSKSFRGIEFLGRSDCPHSPAMEKNLSSALENSGMKIKYKYIDLASLPTNDYRRGYGTPTVLINGEDLFGMARPMQTAAAPTWRFYSGGVPSSESIEQELSKFNKITGINHSFT